MSLINEALKRTRDASYQSSVPQPAAPSYQRQSQTETRGSKSSLLVMVVVALVAIVGVATVGLRLATGLRKLKDGFASTSSATNDNVPETQQTSVSAPKPVLIAKADAPATEPPTVATQPTPPPVAPAATAKAAEDELVGRVMEKIKAEQTSTDPKQAPADLPKLVLQGITSAADGNEAMINGVSLREGEDIEGARITTIERRVVRLDFGGREIVLRLP